MTDAAPTKAPGPPLLTAEMAQFFLKDSQSRIVTKGEAPVAYGEFFPMHVIRALHAIAAGRARVVATMTTARQD